MVSGPSKTKGLAKFLLKFHRSHSHFCSGYVHFLGIFTFCIANKVLKSQFVILFL